MISLDKSDSLDNDSDKIVYDFVSSVTYSFCAFYLRSGKSVVGVLWSGVFAPTVVDSKGGIFASDVLVPTIVESKCV